MVSGDFEQVRASWISSLRQKIRHDEKKIVATSDLHQKTDD